jgi:hypothetical protein
MEVFNTKRRLMAIALQMFIATADELHANRITTLFEILGS